MIEIGTTLNQRFFLEKELGRGGMGAVYSATDQLGVESRYQGSQGAKW